MYGLIKEVISFQWRTRQDSFSDQWNRIFMCKIFLIISIITGIEQLNDQMQCVIPSNSNVDADFVRSACWINGFYIFPTLVEPQHHASYYGIPHDLTKDGMDQGDELCSTSDRRGQKHHKTCTPLKKLYFLQYQWYAFFIATLGMMCYLPYLLFKVNNNDLMVLRETMKEGNCSAESVVREFFTTHKVSQFQLKLRVTINVLIKVGYLFVNLLTIYFINTSTNQNYLLYGINWMKWIGLSSVESYDISIRGDPTPGNVLLPSMGICDVKEGSRSRRNTIVDNHIFVCEISQHILYQYCFLLLWFLLILTVLVSFCGLTYHLAEFTNTMVYTTWYADGPMRVCRELSLREYKYLQEIRQNDVSLHSDVINLLMKVRYKRGGKTMDYQNANEDKKEMGHSLLI